MCVCESPTHEADAVASEAMQLASVPAVIMPQMIPSYRAKSFKWETSTTGQFFGASSQPGARPAFVALSVMAVTASPLTKLPEAGC